MHNDCSCENPQIPQYAPSAPPEDGNCAQNGVQFYTPPNSSAQKGVEILEGEDIDVEDLSDAFTYRFRVNYNPYIALNTNITSILPFIAGVSALENGLVRFGRTVDRVDLVWTQSKTVVSQSVSSSLPGFSPPALLPAERNKSITGLSITNNTSFTIAGNDGAGEPGSSDSDSASIGYGNLARWGVSADLIGGLASTLQGLFSGFGNSINTNTRARSIFATGVVNQHELYFYPSRFGEATFQKGIFVGGFVRLKNVNGTLYQTIPDGETEDPISINNGYASENYYVYMSIYDNQADSETPIVIS